MNRGQDDIQALRYLKSMIFIQEHTWNAGCGQSNTPTEERAVVQLHRDDAGAGFVTATVRQAALEIGAVLCSGIVQAGRSLGSRRPTWSSEALDHSEPDTDRKHQGCMTAICKREASFFPGVVLMGLARSCSAGVAGRRPESLLPCDVAGTEGEDKATAPAKDNCRQPAGDTCDGLAYGHGRSDNVAVARPIQVFRSTQSRAGYLDLPLCSLFSRHRTGNPTGNRTLVTSFVAL